ncbi:MAG: hypothetical protein M3540_08925 [Actinomycetota bacterium]|nr:hypothetical protein [Actinomycetota bacterium]
MRNFAASTLAAALLVAGCGGGGDGRLSRADYAKQADAICAEYNVKLNALPRPKNETELVGFVDKAVPLVSDASDRLSELSPPQDEQKIATAWNKANADIVRALERLRAAAKAQDRPKMQAALADGNKANQHANDLARTLGMKDCAK